MKAFALKWINCVTSCSCTTENYEIIISRNDDTDGNFFQEEPEELQVSHFSFKEESLNASKLKFETIDGVKHPIKASIFNEKPRKLSALTASTFNRSHEWTKDSNLPILRRPVSEYLHYDNVEKTKKLLMEIVLEETDHKRICKQYIEGKRMSALL